MAVLCAEEGKREREDYGAQLDPQPILVLVVMPSFCGALSPTNIQPLFLLMDNTHQWTLRHGSHCRIEARLALSISRRRTATRKGTFERVVAQVVEGKVADPRRHLSVECVVVEIPTRTQTRHVSKHARHQRDSKTTHNERNIKRRTK
jgi:hypothetical protein